jgi:hypothetical protein
MELVQIFWIKLDDDTIDISDNVNDDPNYTIEYIIDLKNNTLVKAKDFITSGVDSDELYVFYGTALTSIFTMILSEDEELLLSPETLKYLMIALKSQLVNHKHNDIDNGLDGFKWEKPALGEMTLVFDVESYKCNSPTEPEEWDTRVMCVGSLGNNYEIKSVGGNNKVS